MGLNTVNGRCFDTGSLKYSTDLGFFLALQSNANAFE